MFLQSDKSNDLIKVNWYNSLFFSIHFFTKGCNFCDFLFASLVKLYAVLVFLSAIGLRSYLEGFHSEGSRRKL